MMNSKTEMSISTVSASIAACIGFIGVAIGGAGAYLQSFSPTVQDGSHTIPFNNHGVIHYRTPLVNILPWLGLLLILGSIVFSWLKWSSISSRIGISEKELLRTFRLFRPINIEQHKESK